MLSALLGLLGSLFYGASDFFGGRAADRMPAERVTAINSLVGFALLSLAALVFGADFSPGAVLWGAVAGVAGVFALVLLYGCLALGPMSILAPIMALVSAVVPITIALGRGDRLSPTGYIGLAVGLVAVVLICFVPGARVVRPSARGALMATGAGVAIGLYLFFLDFAPVDSGLAPSSWSSRCRRRWPGVPCSFEESCAARVPPPRWNPGGAAAWRWPCTRP